MTRIKQDSKRIEKADTAGHIEKNPNPTKDARRPQKSHQAVEITQGSSGESARTAQKGDQNV